jgi:membrane protein DedA with SNARE-associated domain
MPERQDHGVWSVGSAHVRRSSGGRGTLRLAFSIPAVLALGFLHIHFHHHFHGPPFDYVGLGIASGLSGAGAPGPGESLLIAAGILAASGKLDLLSVIMAAFIGSTIGGVIGWYAGLKAGRAVWLASGPLRRWRVHTLEWGEGVFRRYPALAIILTPSWVAGIHGVRSAVYQPLNALGAALWAVGVGLGAYFIGPSVVDFVGDLGIATAALLGLFLVVAVTVGVIRRRRVQPGTRQSAD